MPDQPKIDFFWKPMGYTQPQGWATSNYQQSTTTSSVGPTVLSSPLRGRPFYPSPKPIFFLPNSRAWPALHPPKSSLPPPPFFFLIFFLFVLFFLDQMIEVFFLFIQIPCLGFFFSCSVFVCWEWERLDFGRENAAAEAKAASFDAAGSPAAAAALPLSSRLVGSSSSGF